MGSKLEVPIAELLVHFIVTVVALLSIAAIGWFLKFVGLNDTMIPLTSLKLDDAMLMLEVVAAIGIIGFGVLAAIAVMAIGAIKAAKAAWRAP